MMKDFKRLMTMFLLVCIFCISWGSLASAYTGLPVICIIGAPASDASKDSGAIYKCCNEVNQSLWDENLFQTSTPVDNIGLAIETIHTVFLINSYEVKNGSKVSSIAVNMSAYKKLKNSEQQKVMQIALDTIHNSNISRVNRNKIYNELCELDTTTSSLVRQLSSDVNADFAKAYKYFKPFSSPIGILLGLITIAVFVLLGITGVVDIAYITIPFVQVFLGKLSQNERPRFVSLEAANAIKEMESKAGQEYVNPLGLYFKAKIKQYIALAICVLYLISGQIFTLVSQWIVYFTGFVKF